MEALEKSFYPIAEKLYAQNANAQGANGGADAGAQGANNSQDNSYYTDFEDKTK